MQHYVCPACGGVSEQAKNCETQGCAREGQPLAECSCADNQHAEVKEEKQ